MSVKINQQRRQLCSAVGAAALAVPLIHLSSSTQAANGTRLPIPALLDSLEIKQPIDIHIRATEHQFYPDKPSQTLGYNGSYLGPTVRMYRGRSTRLRFHNHLAEPTTVHGHGLHVPGAVDGGPQLRIDPGAVWDVTLPIEQQASTNWYHPHLMGTTARQVHSGLAGFYLIEDENSLALGLPNRYGIDDIPLVLQDRNFSNGTMVGYPKQHPDDLREDTLVINGAIDPVLEVPQGLVRLRLLNGANARAFQIQREDGRPMNKIATEGGLLESPVAILQQKLSPGERNELVIDMSDGQPVTLMAVFLAKKYTRWNTIVAPEQRMLRLVVNPKLPVVASQLPEQLNKIVAYKPSDALVTRRFKLDDMAINGQKMNMAVINERVRLGQLERWIVKSGRHPFHMHGTSFQILSINGLPPAAEDRGWKDTINPRGSTELLMRFDYLAPEAYPYMYHCHILEHEDMGMMGQFTVT